MNTVALIGRLTREPDIKRTDDTTIARYTLAVDRRGKNKETDFIGCVAFGKNAEFVEKYLTKGQKIGVTGRIQTGSYTNKEGAKVYTTDVVVAAHDFAESKKESEDWTPWDNA